MQSLYLYLLTLPVLALLDLAWLGTIAKPFYKAQLGALLSENPVWAAVVLFYLLYAAGLVYFVIAPAVAEQSLLKAFLTGAAFGLVAYGTYDLTSLAITPGWSLWVTVVDMAWGTFAGAATSALVYWIGTGLIGL